MQHAEELPRIRLNAQQEAFLRGDWRRRSLLVTLAKTGNTSRSALSEACGLLNQPMQQQHLVPLIRWGFIDEVKQRSRLGGERISSTLSLSEWGEPLARLTTQGVFGKIVDDDGMGTDRTASASDTVPDKAKLRALLESSVCRSLLVRLHMMRGTTWTALLQACCLSGASKQRSVLLEAGLIHVAEGSKLKPVSLTESGTRLAAVLKAHQGATVDAILLKLFAERMGKECIREER